MPAQFEVVEIGASVVGRDNGLLVDVTSPIGQMLFTPILGPTATLTARLLLDEYANRTCFLADLASLLGLPTRGSTMLRALDRLQRFRVARWTDTGFGIARSIGLNPAELGRLHPTLVDRYLGLARPAAA